MLRVRAEENLISIVSSRPEGLASKWGHLGHHMRWVSVQAQPWFKALGSELMKLSDPIRPIIISLGQPSIQP